MGITVPIKVTGDDLDEFGILKPLDDYSMEMKRNPTIAEKKLWERIKQLDLCQQIQQQKVFGWFIIDFVFTRYGVGVELDGPIHKQRSEYDTNRDAWIEMCGLKIIRFPNQLAIENPQLIIDTAMSHVPLMCFSIALQRATSRRQVDNELKLAAKGVKHNDTGNIVPLDSFTAAQQAGPCETTKVVDTAHHKKARCPNCNIRVGALKVRCKNCCAIVRRGWIGKHGPGKDPNKPPSPNARKVTIKRGRVVIDGVRQRPKCPHCGRGVAGHWLKCKQCQSAIIWEVE